jgi:hypothetical protein
MGVRKFVFIVALITFMFMLSVSIIVMSSRDVAGTLNLSWITTISIFIFCLYFLMIYMVIIIRKKQIAKLPIIQSHAVLLEKTQDINHSSSTYFLTFILEDESRKTFNVELNEFAEISKDEKGVLKYKQRDKKSEHYLSYIFVGFEKE